MACSQNQFTIHRHATTFKIAPFSNLPQYDTCDCRVPDIIDCSQDFHFLTCCTNILLVTLLSSFRAVNYRHYIFTFGRSGRPNTLESQLYQKSIRVFSLYHSWRLRDSMPRNWSYFEFSHHILQQYLLCLNIFCNW